MPGSIITSVLPAPYLSAVWNGTATKSGDVLTFTAPHGLQTGDIVYTGLPGTATNAITYGFHGIYVIVLSSTSISLASSLVNATNNVVLSLSGFPGGSQQFRNVPDLQTVAFFGLIPLSAWQSRSVSSQVFSLNTPVAISATTPPIVGSNDQIQPYYIGLKTANNSYVCGFGGRWENGQWRTRAVGDTLSGFSAGNNSNAMWVSTSLNSVIDFRLTINSNKQVSIQRLSSGVWVTGFTSTVLSATQDPLYFFVCTALNNVSITNCQVTYL